FALLPELERDQTILFSRHRLRLRNDHRILRSAALAAFDSLNVRNDAEDWQARERLEVINRTESRIVLLQDECQNKAQSKSSARAHQYEPRPLRRVRTGGEASAYAALSRPPMMSSQHTACPWGCARFALSSTKLQPLLPFPLSAA